MNRPYVAVLVAASADGRVSIGPNRTMWDDLGDERLQKTMGGETWNEVEPIIRAQLEPHVELQGSASLVREGAELRELPPTEAGRDELYQDYLPAAVVDRPNHEGWLGVVDGRGRLRSGFRYEEERPEWHMLHLVSHGVAPEYLAFLRDTGIPYLVTGDQRVDLAAALAKLRHKLGAERVLSTAGGRLNGALIRAGLVDEVNILVHPVIIGGFETPSLFDSPDLKTNQWPAPLGLKSVQAFDNGSVWLRYTVRELPGKAE